MSVVVVDVVLTTARIPAQRRDETAEEREGNGKRLMLAARRGGSRTAAEHAAWADADDDGFSKQEWNPARPMTDEQVDRVRVAKPFEVLAGFLASSAAARCFKA